MRISFQSHIEQKTITAFQSELKAAGCFEAQVLGGKNDITEMKVWTPLFIKAENDDEAGRQAFLIEHNAKYTGIRLTFMKNGLFLIPDSDYGIMTELQRGVGIGVRGMIYDKDPSKGAVSPIGRYSTRDNGLTMELYLDRLLHSDAQKKWLANFTIGSSISSAMKEVNEILVVSKEEAKRLGAELIDELSKKKGSIDYGRVFALIASGADVNAKDMYGRTPMMLASLDNDIDTINMLIRYKADVRQKDDNGKEAVNFASDKLVKESLEEAAKAA
jgi:Ankyrin repeat